MRLSSGAIVVVVVVVLLAPRAASAGVIVREWDFETPLGEDFGIVEPAGWTVDASGDGRLLIYSNGNGGTGSVYSEFGVLGDFSALARIPHGVGQFGMEVETEAGDVFTGQQSFLQNPRRWPPEFTWATADGSTGGSGEGGFQNVGAVRIARIGSTITGGLESVTNPGEWFTYTVDLSDAPVVVRMFATNVAGLGEASIDNLRIERTIKAGDSDLDNGVDFDDIEPFVMGLQSAATYEATYGVPPTIAGDIDGNGGVDFDDIAGFVAILNGGLVSSGAQNVPEPATAILAAIGLLGLVACAWRQRGAA